MVVEAILSAVTLGLALVLATVALTAYSRAGHRRILIVGIAFLAFAVKGAFLVASLFVPTLAEAFRPSLPFLLLDLVILSLLYGAMASP